MLPSTDYNGVAARYKFTSESSAGQVASPAVPEAFKIYNNATVHDLFTPSTIGVSGFPYSQLYFAQWQEDGTKEAIWAATPVGYTTVLAPPYVVETDDPTTTTTVDDPSTTTPTTTETDSGFLPVFELYMALFAAFSLMLTKKFRKNRRKS
ncbi:MAG: hypothetical protein GPJ54_12045 [Candidatus Heimdallarchaeota archaeon]|nr:hypothetical protein [Candidatus Heimdallarchaeota archaeon]